MTPRPPRGAVWLLRAVLDDRAFEIIAGDLDEEYRRGRRPGWYWRQALKSAVAHGAGRVVSGTKAFGADLRIAARTLARQRRLALVATLTLGFGMALCISVMTAINAYLVRGLPYPEADRLYNVSLYRPGMDMPPRLQDLEWESLDDLIELSITWDLDLFNLRGSPYSEAAQGTWVTQGYMTGFGIRPAMGRAFEAGDFDPTAPPVAIISHRLWRTRFNGDPAIIGKHFESYSNDRPDDIGVFTIVGVLPESHWHIQAYYDVLSPLKARGVPYVVRLRPGVPAEDAARRISALVRDTHPMPEAWSASVDSQLAAYVVTVRPLLMTLAAAAGLVLLIASANVAVLLLIRASDRRGELVVRRALGATLIRIVRMVVAEAVVLGTAAVTVGVGAAYLIIEGLAPFAARQLGRAVPGGPSALQLDGVVLFGAALAGLVIVSICSVVPALASVRGLTPASSQRAATGSRAQQRTRAALVAAEIGASLALLVSAAVMVQSGLRILNTDVGLRTDGIETSNLSMQASAYPELERRVALFDRIIRESETSPHLLGVAFGNSWPLQAAPQRDVRAAGAAAPQNTRTGVLAVSANYFEVLDIPLIEGRPFGPQDHAGGVRVAIASETLARRLWPGSPAAGRRLLMLPAGGAPAEAPPVEFEIVGVVGDTRHSHADDDLADLLLPYSQSAPLRSFAYLRTGANVGAAVSDFRAAVSRVDPGVVTGSTRPLADILDAQRAGPRFLAQLLVVFAVLSVLLALLGLHGVIAYAAGQRRREIAIRMAIGASRGSITAAFLKQSAVIIAIGLGLGVAGALSLGQLLESQLFGVRANDPGIIAVAALAFGVCACMASLGPARKAAATEPAEALKDGLE